MGFRAIVCAWAVLMVLPPSTSMGQQRFNLSPSFSAQAVYDDNLFFSGENPTAELYSRFTPAVGVSLRASRTVTLTGSYSFDAEYFPDHPELDNAFARQRASAGFAHRLSPTASWSFGATWADTNTPRDLVEDLGIDFSRRSAQSYSAQVGFQHRLSPADSWNVGYQAHILDLGDDFDDDAIDAHLVTLGWRHGFTPRTSFAIDAGPRYSDGVVDATVTATLSRQSPRGGLSFSYEHGRRSVPSRIRNVDSNAFRGNARYGINRRFQVTASPGVSLLDGDELETRVYWVAFGASYRIARWLYFFTQYRGSYEERTFFSADGSNPVLEDFFHNIGVVGISVGYPLWRF